MSIATSPSLSDASAAERFIVVGHPGHKRVASFQAALARRGLPSAEVVAWRDLLCGAVNLDEAFGENIVVRLESPGQDFEVEKQFLALGAEQPETEDVGAAFLPAADARQLTFDRGRLLYPRQWYRGFRAILQRLARGLGKRPGLRWMSHPDDVAIMFDKRLCQQRFAAAGIPIPMGLGPVRCFDELMERLRQTRRYRVFVKLASGSSASGVVAFMTDGRRCRATTTAELVRQQGSWIVYNSRRIRVYESLEEIAALLDTLCREGVQVEEWLPKAETQGGTFDLRVLVVAGEIRHTVVRVSTSPFCNLHLLNQRGDLEQVRQDIPAERWDAALESCRRAADLFPRSLHAGVDLAFTPGGRRHAVLEINAFGDLLPGLSWQGLDTYEAELVAWDARRQSTDRNA